ncbi:MAG: hypothetical protein QJR01_05625 [Kyrpidia sp.]|nr:hypothetical protein [Kyrpidia sp.]
MRRGRGMPWRYGWVWLLGILLLVPGSAWPANAHPADPRNARVDIGDARSGDILGQVPWSPELAALVEKVARSCRRVDPTVQIRFPPGKILRIAFRHPVEFGMAHPVRELWIVLPRDGDGTGRVIAFDRENRMTVYCPGISLGPLKQWVDRHPGGGAPVHRSASPE